MSNTKLGSITRKLPAFLGTVAALTVFTACGGLSEADVERLADERVATLLATVPIATLAPEPTLVPTSTLLTMTPSAVPNTSTPMPTPTPTQEPDPTVTPTPQILDPTPEPTTFVHQSYDHPAGYWQIEYPAGWREPSPTPNLITDESELRVFGSGFPPYINIFVWRGWGEKADLDTYEYAAQSLSMKSESEYVDEFRVVSFEKVSFGDANSYRAIYLESQQNSTDVHMVSWLKDGIYLYEIDAFTDALGDSDDLNRSLEIMSEVLNSFRPLTP